MSLRRRTQSLVLAIVLILVGLSGRIGDAQQLSNVIDIQHQNAIRALGLALSAAPDKLDPLLERLGFRATSQPPGFENWPTVRKLETAYLSAASSGGVNGGQQFLRTLSRVVALDISNAIRYERSLQAYFPEPRSTLLPSEPHVSLSFGAIASESATVDPGIREAILSLEKYVERVPGGLQSVLAGCCGLGPADTYDILRRSADRADALTAAIQKGRIPPGSHERLLRAVRQVADNTNAVRRDPRLEPLLSQLNGGNNSVPRTTSSSELHVSAGPTETNPQTTRTIAEHIRQAATAAGTSDDMANLLSSLPSAGAGGGGGGGGGSGQDANLRRYRSAQADVAREMQPRSPTSPRGVRVPTVARPSFRIMSGVAAGFGGVVFGASVVAGSETPRPTELRWVEDGVISGTTWGHFDVVLATDEVRMTRRIRQAEAFAAIEIVKGQSGSFDAIDVTNEEGVGLAGVAPGPWFDKEKRFLVHPALFGLSIGDAAILADATGFVLPAAALDRALEAAGIPQSVRTSVMKWRTAENGFYKITDVPTQIVIRDGAVRVERRAEGAYSAALRRTAFLTFQAFDDDHALPEAARPFYQNVPSLAAALPQFEQLNAFAETFAIVRWATLTKARVIAPAAPARGPARTLVRTADDGSLALVSDAEWFAERANQLDVRIRTAQKRATSALETGGASMDAQQRSRDLFLRIREIAELTLADESVYRLSGAEQGDDERVRRTQERLHQKRDQIIEKLPDLTARDLALYVVAPQDAAELNHAYAEVDAARSAVEDAAEALDAAEDPSVEERIANAPAALRPTLLRLQKAVEAAEAALDRAPLATFGAALEALEAAEEKLDKALPPTDQSAIDIATRKTLVAKKALSSAEANVKQLIRTRMPWFEQWSEAIASVDDLL
jgi:hypothetical protein